MPAKSLTSALIWKGLSNINVNEFTEEKGGLTYLSWSHAWRIMMENYPELQVKWSGTTDEKGVIRDITYYEGGTAMVGCKVVIGEVSREMWLPVMDYKNKSIAHPSSRDISDAKQRCLVKCFSLYGLANYIYSGDSLPEDVTPVTPVTPPKKKATPKKKEESPDVVTSEEASKELKAVVNDLWERGWKPEGKFAQEIKGVVSNPDVVAPEEIQKLVETVKNTGEIALKLHNEKETKADG